MKNLSVVWKDRKRILGMPISFTRYAIDSQRLYISIGLLKTVTSELLLYRILDITSCRTLGQKLFGVGDIVLQTADKSHPSVVLKNIRGCETVRKMISDLVENLRNEKQIRGREMFATIGAMADDDLDNDGIPDHLE